MKRMNLTTKSIAVLVLTIIFFSCRDSNELVPMNSSTTFEKQIMYNGNVWVTAQVTQVISVGTDSLKVLIKNPYNDTIENLQLAIYFQTANTYNAALNYRSTITIPKIAPKKDTVFYLFNYPELPVTSDKIHIKIISERGIISSNHYLASMYDGMAGYLYNTDTVPSQYSSVKGIIEVDGTCSLWLNLNNKDKTVEGKLIDTLSLLNGFLIDGANRFVATLDTLKPGLTFFKILPQQIDFTLKISPQQSGLEKNIKLTLYK